MDSNMRAIVYTTNAGSTEQYAKLLAQETGLPVYSLAEAKRTLSSGTEIVYLGWIMASTVKGYADAAKTVSHLCGLCCRYGTDGNTSRCCAQKECDSAANPAVYLAGKF